MMIKWRDGARSGCSAAVAYEFLENVRKDCGGDLDLDTAVERSRPKDAPLHNELEWNDKKAGHHWRRQQMRRVVRDIHVVRVNAPNTRAYEAIRVEEAPKTEHRVADAAPTHVFRRTEDILADPAGRAELLGQAVRDALAFRRRYASLSELAAVIEVIDTEVAKLA